MDLLKVLKNVRAMKLALKDSLASENMVHKMKTSKKYIIQVNSEQEDEENNIQFKGKLYILYYCF